MAQHNNVGKWGEDVACEYLISQGYAISDRNWRHNHLEVDIVAYKGNRIVFAEVKTRSSEDVDPIEAIGDSKRRHLITAAKTYVEIFRINHEIQFDIIAINGTPDNYHIEHIADAFETPFYSY